MDEFEFELLNEKNKCAEILYNHKLINKVEKLLIKGNISTVSNYLYTLNVLTNEHIILETENIISFVPLEIDENGYLMYNQTMYQIKETS